MTVEAYLNRKNFQYTVKTNGKGKQAVMPCPSCSDPTTFAISLDTGAYSCFRLNKCGIRGSFTDFQRLFGDEPEYLDSDKFIKSNPKYNLPTKKPEKINQPVIDYLKKRGISEDTISKFPLGYLDESIVFMYHKNGKFVNAKYRKIAEKSFSKEKGAMSCLWNQDAIKENRLIITEGEIDTMSLYEYGISAVSLPDGANGMTWIEVDWDYLERFTEIFLVLDNDKAGQSVIDILVLRLGRWRCRNVILPGKDVNECLMKKIPKDEIIDCFKNAQSFDLAELKTCNNYKDEIIEYKNNPQKLEGVVTSILELTAILHGWRDEEVTIWTGQNSSGKSTFLSQEMLHLIDQGKKVCIGSFEMPPRKYLWWLLKQYTKMPFMKDHDVEVALDELSGYLYIIDILGEITKEKLFEVIEFGYRKYGINVFVIDSLMKISLSPDDRKIYGEQKKFVSSLKDFVSKSKTHIHLVAHPRKQEKDDTFVGKSDVAGSGDITNLCDNVVLLHRYSDDQKITRVKQGKDDLDAAIFVKKNREFGLTGYVGLFFDKATKRYYTKGKEEPPRSYYEPEENII